MVWVGSREDTLDISLHFAYRDYYNIFAFGCDDDFALLWVVELLILDMIHKWVKWKRDDDQWRVTVEVKMSDKWSVIQRICVAKRCLSIIEHAFLLMGLQFFLALAGIMKKKVQIHDSVLLLKKELLFFFAMVFCLFLE